MADVLSSDVYGNPVGERLRAAREEKGITLDEVARQTRIPIRHLEHIERGEWEALPAITYSVGFARSYANAVGLDGPAIGAELRDQLGGARSASAGPAAYYEPADPARVPPRSLAIVAAILAVLLIAGYLFWRHQAVGNAPDAAQIADGQTPADQAQAPTPQPKAAPQQGQPAAPAASGPVVLSASQDVWMRVSDGNNPKALFQGTLKAGQQYPVPPGAQAPSVRTGRADAVTVSVGGRAMGPLGPPNKTLSLSLRPADIAGRAQAGGAAPAPNGPAAAPTGGR